MTENPESASTSSEVQIDSDHLYLTQDGDGQIIFVVHPDQQFPNSDTGQVVYIETPDGIDGATELLQSASNIQVMPMEVVPECTSENLESSSVESEAPSNTNNVATAEVDVSTTVLDDKPSDINTVGEEIVDSQNQTDGGSMSVEESNAIPLSDVKIVAKENSNKNSDENSAAEKSDLVDVKNKASDNKSENLENDNSSDKESAQISDDKKSNVRENETEVKQSSIEKNMIDQTENSTKSEFPESESIRKENSVTDDKKLMNNKKSNVNTKEIPVTNSNNIQVSETKCTKESTAEAKVNDKVVGEVFKTPTKNIDVSEKLDSVKKPPIIFESPRAKNVNLKPMAESGPFILHEDDFEMDEGSEEVILNGNKYFDKNGLGTPTKLPELKADESSGSSNGNIFEKIQSKIDVTKKLSEEQNVAKTNDAESQKTSKKQKYALANNKADDKSANTRKSQRSKRAPEKFSDVLDSPSPQKRPKELVVDKPVLQSPTKKIKKEVKVKVGKLPCKMYIRYQQTPAYSPSSTYRCDKCHFTTTRLENIVTHYKEHLKNNDEDENALGLRYDFIRDSFDSLTKSQKPLDDAESNSVSVADNDPSTSAFDKMDSDDELPPAFSNPSSREYVKDDIVIIDWRRISWPAVVRNVNKEKQKVCVTVIDGPFNRTDIQVSLSKAKLVTNEENLLEYLTEFEGKKYAKLLKEVIKKIKEYFNKRKNFILMKPIEFFNLNNAESDEFESISEASDVGDTPVGSSINMIKNISKASIESKNSSVNAYSPSVLQSREKRKIKSKQLLSHITSRKIDDHLIQIYEGKIKCQRNIQYYSKVTSERQKLKRACSFGPIEDENLQKELLSYLDNLMKDKCTHDEHFDLVSYIFEVWLPEAIIKSITDIRKISLTDAENVFATGPIWTEEEKKLMNEEFESIMKKKSLFQSTDRMGRMIKKLNLDRPDNNSVDL